MVKNLPAMQETRGRTPGFKPWVRKIPWRRECLPTSVFLPGEFHGQRSLVSYSPWSHKASDTTERLTLSLPENRERRKRKKKKTDLRTYSLIRW